MPANYVLIGEYTTSVNTASVTFSNIPQTGYTDLKIAVSARTTQTGSGQGVSDISMRFNNNTESVYTYKGLTATGSATSSFALSNENIFTYIAFGAGNDATANVYGSSEITISNYTSTNAKCVSVDATGENNATLSLSRFNAGIWNPATQAAINRIDLYALTSTSSVFLAGTTFSLYGLAAFGTTPTVLPKATGGDIITNDGTYWIHTFLSTGVFTPSTTLSCDYLVVAGGGGGGGHNAGGGGAGGLRSTVTATGGGGTLETALSLSSNTAYAVTVGAGGAGGNNARGVSGNNSVFSTITSVGGAGGGGNNSGQPPVQGGSGGGGTQGTNGSAGTTNQGFEGGNSPTVNNAGGGGGGAGAAGSAQSGVNGGNGGNGVAVSISGTSVTYAGGGGGSSYSGSQGSGGSGGGGAGGYTSAGAGTVNTGSGGGAYNREPGAGGAGGSGIIIVRYTMA